MKILIVEDDPLLQKGLEKAIQKEAYTCTCASTAQEAELFLQTENYSAILLDLGLPDKDGLELLKQWRSHNINLPVLILTARDALEDRVKGLDAGADDYLIKPFELVELFARLRALIRRHQGASDNLIIIDDLSLDLANKQVKKAGVEIFLTPREFAILSRLILKPGKAINRELLQQDIYTWQDNFGSNTLEVYIHHLRTKLGKEMIQTVRGVGYRFGAPT
ncbi:two-component system response regulator PmrA [Neisseria sp. Ec49-e6-T10]|uniref:two-component system response regulator PmrA n=1 Tax=Neisseria sp. Ec49-e6-T10 TaxID=3140744 RepID=UPI003EB88A02